MYELIIVGGGPAGLTAAVYAARKRINTLLVSKELGGQPMLTAGVENYMGYQYIEGPELMEKFEEQVKQFPIEVKTGREVVAVKQADGQFEVTSDKGERYGAKAVLVASGKRSRELNVPGEREFRGKGVTYCAICDGPVFRGQTVAVIGGGNSALEAANDMVKISPQVYLVSITPLTGDAILREKLKEADNIMVYARHEVVRVEGERRVGRVVIRPVGDGKEKRLEVGGVLVEIGLVPNSDMVKGLASLNQLGEIEVNMACETGVTGLYAAGDVTNVPEKQIVVAAGEGAKAALRAHKYLQRLS